MFDIIYNWIVVQVTTNEIFAGVMGGSIFMSTLYMLRKVPSHLWFLFKRQYTCHLVVHNDDRAFEWLDLWLSSHPYAVNTRRLKLTTFWHYDSDGDDEGKWVLSPGPGAHIFFHKRRFIYINRTESEGSQTGVLKRRETIEIYILGRNTECLYTLINEAKNLTGVGDYVKVHSYGNYWNKVATKTRRCPESVILPDNMVENLVEDVEWFIGAIEWYAERSIPYRRGYLLSGPPGCGKSSLVMVIASVHNLPIYVLNLGSVRTDIALISALSDVPSRSILLMEDIDAAQSNREKEKVKNKSITLSAMLNAIDGILASDGRVLFMTTNYFDRLDPALIRPGRIDVHLDIQPLNRKDIIRLFMRFYPGQDSAAKLIDEDIKPMPAANVQSYLMLYPDDPHAAARAISSADT